MSRRTRILAALVSAACWPLARLAEAADRAGCQLGNDMSEED